MAYVGLKAQGLKLQEISDTIGVPKDTITTYVKRANKHGWLKRELLGVEDQIELSLPEQIVGNVAAVLSERDGTTLTLTPAAREMTIAAAKGFGIFKNHEAVKVDGVIGVGFALKVQVELPQGISTLSPIQIRPGSVGGTPAIDAEIMGDGEGASS
jgi:transposase